MAILTTLQGITRYQSGIGDGEDLRVALREMADGSWHPVLHAGSYYLGTEERYLFSKKGTHTYTVLATGAVHTVSIGGLDEDVTKLGPVLLFADGNPRPLMRVASPLRAFRATSFTGGEVKSAAASGLLISLVSHAVTGILLSVPSTGDIISNEDYVYDPRLGSIQIRDNNPPSLFQTYIVGEDQDMLRQEEILRVDLDGLIRAQLSPVFYAAGSDFNPLIRRPGRGGQTAAAGVAVSGNVIRPAASGLFSAGDIVAVEYYVANSFSAVPSGSVLVVRHFASASGSYTIEYETGQGWYDTSQLPSGSTNRLQLNPILEPRESGFLYLVDADEPWPSADSLRIALSNHNPLYLRDRCPGLVIAVSVFDGELEPLPQAVVATTVTGVSGTLALAYQDSPVTNGLGRVLYHFNLMGSGSATVTALVTGTTVSGTLTFEVRPQDHYDEQSRKRLGKLLLHLEEAPYRGSLRRLNAHIVYPDGAPFQPDSAAENWNSSVTFTASQSAFYNLDGTPRARPVEVRIDDDGIAQILVDPVAGDVLRAEIRTPTEGRRRVAAPIAVPREVGESA